MAFLVFLLVIAILWIWTTVSGLSSRVSKLDEQMLNAKDQLGVISARLLAPTIIPRSVAVNRNEPSLDLSSSTSRPSTVSSVTDVPCLARPRSAMHPSIAPR